MRLYEGLHPRRSPSAGFRDPPPTPPQEETLMPIKQPMQPTDDTTRTPSAKTGTSPRVPVAVLQLHRELASLLPGDEVNRLAIVAEHRRDPFAPED